MKNKNKCEFDIGLSAEEIASWDWMRHVLASIRKAGPGHQDYRNATVFSHALNKVQDYCHEMHSTAHRLEERGIRLVATKAQMMIQPMGES